MHIYRYGVKCWHHETRTYTETYTDSQGHSHTRTRTETVRVDTWSGSEEWEYQRFEDHSGQLTDEIKRFDMTKLYFGKNITFGDASTEVDYTSSRDGFYDSNRWRDVHMDTWARNGIQGYVDLKLCLVDLARKPAMLGFGWYLLWSLVLPCSYGYRLWLERMSVKGNFTFRKRVFISRRQ
jgi:hypothetical protein